MSEVTEQEKSLYDKYIQARWTPATFAMVASDNRWKLYEHVKVIDDLLLYLNDRKLYRLMNWMPPQHGKSWLTSVNFPVWYLGTNPDDRFLHASYEANFAATFGNKARNLFRQWAKEVFGLKLDDTSKSKAHWDIDGREGGMDTAGVGGAFTGKKGDAINIDDPHKNRTEAKSKIKQETAYEWYQETVDTRLSKKGILNLIQTRWDVMDLSGRILEVEPHIYADEALKILRDGGSIDKDTWVILTMPAIAKENDILGRKIGEALCPDLHPIKDLLGKQARMPPQRFAALYQGSPVPDIGDMFERDWFEVISIAEYVEHFKDNVIGRVRAWDLAGTKKKESANTAGVKAFVTKKNEFVIRNAIVTQEKPGKVRTLVKATANFDQVGTKIRIAVDPGQAPLDQMEQYARELMGFNFKPFRERDIGSKEDRAENVATHAQLFKVYVVDDGKWDVDAYIEEHIDFPNGKWKDRVDATSVAYAVLFGNEPKRVPFNPDLFSKIL